MLRQSSLLQFSSHREKMKDRVILPQGKERKQLNCINISNSVICFKKKIYYKWCIKYKCFELIQLFGFCVFFFFFLDILSWNRIMDFEFDFFKHEIFYLMVIARGWFVSLHFDMDIGKSILSLKYILIKWNK